MESIAEKSPSEIDAIFAQVRVLDREKRLSGGQAGQELTIEERLADALADGLCDEDKRLSLLLYFAGNGSDIVTRAVQIVERLSAGEQAGSKEDERVG